MIKQLQIERGISVFDKQTGRLIQRFPIPFSLDQLKTVFTPYEDDPLMYDIYHITKESSEKIAVLGKGITLNTDAFDYELDCVQVR